MMTVKFTLEPADIKAFSAHNRRHSPQHKRMRYIMFFVFAALSLHYGLTSYHEPLRQVVGFSVAFAVYLVVAWLSGHLLRTVAFWRSFTSQQQPGLFCEHSITLADDAVVEVTSVNEGRNLWSGIHSVINASKYIYIFVAANSAHLIPKRAFSSPEMADAFFQRASQLHSNARKGEQACRV
ncbi:MAG: hypothetical protein JWL59_1585 [Chthoniobacteraceae bacterium]|nr:hypothetical protein [Chthoniobacteraceae bacterium]